MRMTLKEIAERIGGRLVGDGSVVVESLSSPESARSGSLCLLWEYRLLDSVPKEVPVLGKTDWIQPPRNGIEVEDPKVAAIPLMEAWAEEVEISPGVHEMAWVDPAAKIDETATVGPMCVVCEGAEIGPGCVLSASVYVGRNVSVGRGSRLEPGVVLLDGTRIGENVLIHANAVLGADGFGFVPRGVDRSPLKIPQIGRVVVEDDVEIGACVTIDRATLEETRIGSGTKIDNHVHIGHNCHVGRNCLLVAMVGLGGSTVLGDGVIMAARSGTRDHVKVGPGAIVAGLSAPTKDVPAGMVVSGYPAVDHKKDLKRQALFDRLPELWEELDRLKREVEDLRGEKS